MVSCSITFTVKPAFPFGDRNGLDFSVGFLELARGQRRRCKTRKVLKKNTKLIVRTVSSPKPPVMDSRPSQEGKIPGLAWGVV